MIKNMSSSISEKYTPQSVVQSQWDVKWLIALFSMILIYGFVAILINYLSIRFSCHKVDENKPFEQQIVLFLAKRTCIIMVTSVMTFSLIIIIIRILSPSNFVHMACSLLLEYTWLLAVIFASLLSASMAHKRIIPTEFTILLFL